MKRNPLHALLSAAVLFVAVVPALRAQTLPAAKASAAAPASLEDRRKALNALFHSYWEDVMLHDPEFASTIGDKRYNDKISDYSVKAVNEELERGQNYLLQLAAIDHPTHTSPADTSVKQLGMTRHAGLRCHDIGPLHRDSVPDLPASSSAI